MDEQRAFWPRIRRPKQALRMNSKAALPIDTNTRTNSSFNSSQLVFFAVDRKSGKGGTAPAGRAKEFCFLTARCARQPVQKYHRRKITKHQLLGEFSKGKPTIRAPDKT